MANSVGETKSHRYIAIAWLLYKIEEDKELNIEKRTKRHTDGKDDSHVCLYNPPIRVYTYIQRSNGILFTSYIYICTTILYRW